MAKPDDEIDMHFIAFGDIDSTALEALEIKGMVLSMLVAIYRNHGRESLERTLTDMHAQTDLGVVPVAVELVVALSNCIKEVREGGVLDAPVSDV